ncbi:MAG: hypothetical protein AVDCRST_MAG75-1665, partial [uncultured Propionibacteriaceae bacterium]
CDEASGSSSGWAAPSTSAARFAATCTRPHRRRSATGSRSRPPGSATPSATSPTGSEPPWPSVRPNSGRRSACPT